MRVAYILSSGLESENGVSRKIACQLHEWMRSGIKTCLFAPALDGKLSDLFEQIPHNLACHQGKWPWFPNGIVDRQLGKMAIAWKPDLIYTRFGCRSLVWLPVFHRLPVVFEANTNDVAEARRTFSLHALVYHLLTRNLFLRQARGLVAVTNEIASIPSIKKHIKNRIVIANGFDLESVKPSPPHEGAAIKAVFLAGGEYPWHGVDKLLRLARLLRQWQFDIIGVNNPPANSPENVHYYGRLTQNEYTSIIGSADVAFGTLALHRKEMDEACPLKTREYLALGLPMVIGYHDPDFPNPEDFILKIPNSENNIEESVNAIERFGTMWKGKRVPKASVKHVDVRAKEKQRLAFFQNILADSRMKKQVSSTLSRIQTRPYGL